MAIRHYFCGLHCAALWLVPLVLLAGCAGRAPSPDPSAPEVRLATAAASGWQAGELGVRLTVADGGWDLSIDSLAKGPTRSLLFEAYFPPEYRATQVQQLTPGADLSLLIADRPGVLALGVLLPPGQSIAPGVVLRARLVRQAGPVRAASKAPAGVAGQVPDLAGTEDGVGGWALSWGYYSTGDLNQDSQVSIADLALLGMHYGEQAPAFPALFPPDSIGAVVDTNADGQIGLGDLTPLGINYMNRVSGYRVFRADGPDLATANIVQVADAAFGDSTLAAGHRRRFGTTLPSAALVDGAYYFLRPYDSADSTEGVTSNVVQFNRTVHLKFYKPGSGNSIADSSQCQDPSLVLMPPIPGVSERDAPVVVYTTLGGGGGIAPLMLGYYGESGWTTQEIGGGGNFSMPQAVFIPGAGANPGEGVVVANAIGGTGLVERRYDQSWQFTTSQDIGAGTGVFSRLAFDRDPATGHFGVAHAYTNGGGGNIVYSSSDGSGAWTTQPAPVYDGESIAGLDFSFDPAGTAPWLIFTHGTTSFNSGRIELAYSMEQARLSGAAWTITPIPYPDSPQLVDLAFRSDGTPQLVCTAARDYTIPLLSWTISMLYDVVTFEQAGSAWIFQTDYESSMSFSLGIPPTKLDLALNMASDASWAKPDELIYTESAGSITIDIATYIPQDGALANTSYYMTRQAGAFYAPSSYYTGDAGRAYSWAVTTPGNPVCAYVRSTTITAQDVLAGNFQAAGELAFWQP
jgi:hypothetical protein